MEAVVLMFVFLAIASCWMVVRDTGMEREDDAEQEEYLKKWMGKRNESNIEKWSCIRI